MRNHLRMLGMAAAAAIPLVGVSTLGAGVASAKPAALIKVTATPVTETGFSEVNTVIQVETSPSYGGDPVNIDSPQLEATCGSGLEFISIADGLPDTAAEDAVQVILDNDGNATVLVLGEDCEAGPSVIEADLVDAPFYTATTTLNVKPPNVTKTGVFGYPNNEVETGDTEASGNSDVYAVFQIETNPVFAEQYAEIDSPQLAFRCGEGHEWISLGTEELEGSPTAEGVIDNDGNVTIDFLGASCAAGPSTVIADVLAGNHPTYVTTYNIKPPMPTV